VRVHHVSRWSGGSLADRQPRWRLLWAHSAGAWARRAISKARTSPSIITARLMGNLMLALLANRV
jgi:hypothetical protein